MRDLRGVALNFVLAALAAVSSGEVRSFDANATGIPAELYFAPPSAPFKSSGARVSGDAVAVAELRKKVAVAITGGDATFLEETSKRLREQKDLTPSGFPALSLFYTVLEETVSVPGPGSGVDVRSWNAAVDTVTAWTKSYPQSPSASTALASLYIRRATAIRGGHYAKDVTKEQWNGFRRKLDQASEVLGASKAFGAADPYWFFQLADVAKLSSADHDVFLTIIDAALKEHPDFAPIAVSGVDNMLPRWHGSDAAVRAYIQHVTTAVSPDVADVVYARLARRLLTAQFYDHLTVQTLAGMDPDRVRTSWEAVIRRYPDPHNEDAAAQTLCMLEDRKHLGPLMQRIGDSPLLETWATDGTADYFLGCRDYATAP